MELTCAPTDIIPIYLVTALITAAAAIVTLWVATVVFRGEVVRERRFRAMIIEARAAQHKQQVWYVVYTPCDVPRSAPPAGGLPVTSCTA